MKVGRWWRRAGNPYPLVGTGPSTTRKLGDGGSRCPAGDGTGCSSLPSLSQTGHKGGEKEDAMKFTKEFLQEMEGETVEDRIIGVGRWSIHHARVFKHEGKFYATNYSVGATENQEEAPYEYSPDEIECEEVFPYERTVTVYKPAAAVGV
jgi:hypothetical protein